MPQTNSSVRELGELTLRELAGLHILNEALREAERWIREHSVREQYRGESDSTTAKPPHSAPTSASPAELTSSASVVCMSVTADPCNAAAHSEVARLEATAVVGQINARVDPKEIAVAGESLFGLQPCALFGTLLAELHGDWLQLLAVRLLKVELTASASREFEVATAFLQR
ncbi:hypothetical protein LMG22037_06295 [Paraburkholderia phenoliruptrix]|uniref:Uncharacterized protein n=1 Tax=Paraburkholderia phenoliruptrix TaxID=252970 RepID=A0A6J5CMJ6_9BURK|nr:hypothetical protein LMG22037_06295 [Paraburkholderia phenoliruptrix]